MECLTLVASFAFPCSGSPASSMRNGTIPPPLEPPPPPARPAPVLLSFKDFIAQQPGTTAGTGGSSVCGGVGRHITPKSRNPVTPIHRGGSAAGSSDVLGFGELGGDDLGRRG